MSKSKRDYVSKIVVICGFHHCRVFSSTRNHLDLDWQYAEFSDLSSFLLEGLHGCFIPSVFGSV